MSKAQTVSDRVKSPQRAPGTPNYSDVCFSPRWRRPRNADDPRETMRDAKAFHATRFDWVYNWDTNWIAECRKLGYHFTGALNTILTDGPGERTREKGRILDKDGNRVAAPWMRGWNGYWGCANSPDYRKTYIDHARILIDGGIDAIQMDDPPINVAAVAWGGCFCEHCQEKAEQQGKDLNNRRQMMALQTESVREFYASVRQEIDAYAKRHVPWSSNNGNGRWSFPYGLFDFGMGELPHKSVHPGGIHAAFSAAARSGRQQIFTLVSDDVPHTRRAIATAYACGGHIIVPYDVYFGSKPRIFFTPEDCADLYGFVRAMTPYLDGYQEADAQLPQTAATQGSQVADRLMAGGDSDTLVAGPGPLTVDNTRQLCAVVRAKPGDKRAPAAIHLVEWGEPAPARLLLRAAAYFGGRSLKVRLLVPPPYDKALHDRAEEDGDYSRLAVSTDVEVSVEGELTVVRIPALKPWGMLLVEAQE